MSLIGPISSATDNCSNYAVNILYTYILLLSAAFTLLVLFVCSVVSFIAPSDTQKLNTP